MENLSTVFKVTNLKQMLSNWERENLAAVPFLPRWEWAWKTNNFFTSWMRAIPVKSVVSPGNFSNACNNEKNRIFNLNDKDE